MQFPDYRLDQADKLLFYLSIKSACDLPNAKTNKEIREDYTGEE